MPGPPPPPPPMGGGMGPGGGAAPAGRGQLLGAIHKGVTLKKTVTNDRSAPIVGGNKPSPGSASPAGVGRGGPLRPANSNGAPSGGPPLAGLFAGGMPKLKPANRGAGNESTPPPSWEPPNRSTGDSQAAPPSHGPANGSKRVFPGDIKNRGPPPQPPPAAYKPAMPATDTDRRKNRNASLKKELSASRIVQQGIGKLTNKPEPSHKVSEVQGRLRSRDESIVSVTSMKSDGRYEDGTVARVTKRLSATVVESAKPEPVVTRDNVSKIKRQLSRHGIEDGSSSDGRLSVGSRGNHGKPNLAPRPPSDSPQQRVSRAQSLRAPRSPPVLPPSPHPPGFQSNSIHQQQQHASSTSGLNQAPAPPHSVKAFQTLPSKSRPRPPMSRPPPPPSRPPPPPLHAPPPPPPHRTMPAAPAMPANMGMPTNGAQRLQPGPPPTPARNSSMRGAEMFERNFTWRDKNEFPRPPPFLARPKVFNSVSVRMAGGGGKAQAPQPPVLQLGNKMFSRDTSRC